MPKYKIQETITRLLEAEVTANNALEARYRFNKQVDELEISSVTEQTDINIQEIVEEGVVCHDSK